MADRGIDPRLVAVAGPMTCEAFTPSGGEVRTLDLKASLEAEP